jgi:hypothetical protein
VRAQAARSAPNTRRRLHLAARMRDLFKPLARSGARTSRPPRAAR